MAEITLSDAHKKARWAFEIYNAVTRCFLVELFKEEGCKNVPDRNEENEKLGKILDKAFPEVLKNLQPNTQGIPISPTGSPRDIFLHLKQQKLLETQNFLEKKIGKKAKIIETSKALKEGLFGIGKVSKSFSERAGNLLILPYGNETIWFEHSKGRRFTLLGHHGGLNQNEMLVPFMASNICDLK